MKSSSITFRKGLTGLLAGFILLFNGCYYKVTMPPPAAVPAPRYAGPRIPAKMSLYLSPEFKSYVWIGRALNFETKAYRFEVPIGPTVSKVSRKTFRELFESVVQSGSKTPRPNTIGLIVPTITNYYFGIYDRFKTAGTLKSTIAINVKILDINHRVVWEGNAQGEGEKTMTQYFRRTSEWNDNLPFTTQAAISNAFREIAKQISAAGAVKQFALNPPPKMKTPPPPPEPENAHLYVQADPPDARIRILNIRPVYTPGIELPPGAYHIEVSKPGYRKQKKWIDIADKGDVTVAIPLAQTAQPKKPAPEPKPKKTVTPAKAAPPPAPAAAPPVPKGPVRQYWAVIIGISRYADSRIAPLRYARKDAEALYDWLVSPSGGRYAPSNVKLLLDGNATGKNIKNALFSWLRKALEEDVVIIYFAGHGSPDSPDTPDNLYLLPHDTQYDNITATGFPMWDIETALKRFIIAKSVVVIADACHSGGVGQAFDVARRAARGVDVNPINTRLEKLADISGGVAVISASGDKQLSQEGRKWGGGHGVFTYYFLEGLKGSADYNRDRQVNLGELIPYLSEQVRRATRNAQSPTIAGRFDPALTIGK